MIFSGSVVYVNPENYVKAKEILKFSDNIEVFAVSEDKTQIIIAIEADSEEHLQKICADLRDFPEILEVAHHIFHFEDEVAGILSGEKVPSLDGFFKSKKREEIKG
jgi:nitrate reductase NapD